jgi:hypothetical protein
MVSPVRGDYRRCQAEIPLIVLCRFPGPALPIIGFDPGKQWLQHAPPQDARKQTPQRDQTAHYDID